MPPVPSRTRQVCSCHQHATLRAVSTLPWAGGAMCRTAAHEQPVHKVSATKRMHHTRALLLKNNHPSHGSADPNSKVPSCRLPMPRTL